MHGQIVKGQIFIVWISKCQDASVYSSWEPVYSILHDMVNTIQMTSFTLPSLIKYFEELHKMKYFLTT